MNDPKQNADIHRDVKKGEDPKPPLPDNENVEEIKLPGYESDDIVRQMLGADEPGSDRSSQDDSRAVGHEDLSKGRNKRETDRAKEHEA